MIEIDVVVKRWDEIIASWLWLNPITAHEMIQFYKDNFTLSDAQYKKMIKEAEEDQKRYACEEVRQLIQQIYKAEQIW